MRQNLAYILVALSLTIFACSKMSVGVNTYDIDYSTSVTFDQNKKLTFVDVISDSRCPVDVDCVWPGEVVIALRATCTPQDTIYFQLTFGEDDEASRDTTIFDIYRVEILEVSPLRYEGVELENEDYSIRVLIEKS